MSAMPDWMHALYGPFVNSYQRMSVMRKIYPSIPLDQQAKALAVAISDGDMLHLERPFLGWVLAEMRERGTLVFETPADQEVLTHCQLGSRSIEEPTPQSTRIDDLDARGRSMRAEPDGLQPSTDTVTNDQYR